MNNIEIWLFLIGTSERARKLRMRVDGLVPPPLDELYGPEPCQCPTTVLFGAGVARKLYSDPATRPALDAWDTGMVSKADLRRYCLDIERARYSGPVFYPDAAWLASLDALAEISRYELNQRILARQLEESLMSSGRISQHT